ncbi:hypothetical protein [Parasphingorhabdus pacifica]
MSSPGDPGNGNSDGNRTWGPFSGGSPPPGGADGAPRMPDQGHQYYDPLTGQPVPAAPQHTHPGPQYGPTQQGHQSGRYQGLGTFSHPAAGGGEPEPPEKQRGPLIATLAASAVAIVAITATIVLVNRDGEPQQPAARETPTAPTSAATATIAPGTAVVPGWQAVPVPERGAVYDVPPGWETESPTNVIGFGPPEDSVTMTGVATHERGFCAGQSGSFRALAGATAREGPDDARVATDTARKLAELAYTVDGTKPQVALSPVQQVRLGADGATDGTRVAATVTPAGTEQCGSPAVLINVIATNNNGTSSVVHITIADQEVPAAVPPDVVDRIGESFRPGD